MRVEVDGDGAGRVAQVPDGEGAGLVGGRGEAGQVEQLAGAVVDVREDDGGDVARSEQRRGSRPVRACTTRQPTCAATPATT